VQVQVQPPVAVFFGQGTVDTVNPLNQLGKPG
jgi:hypothetical protein